MSGIHESNGVDKEVCSKFEDESEEYQCAKSEKYVGLFLIVNIRAERCRPTDDVSE